AARTQSQHHGQRVSNQLEWSLEYATLHKTGSSKPTETLGVTSDQCCAIWDALYSHHHRHPKTQPQNPLKNRPLRKPSIWSNRTSCANMIIRLTLLLHHVKSKRRS